MLFILLRIRAFATFAKVFALFAVNFYRKERKINTRKVPQSCNEMEIYIRNSTGNFQTPQIAGFFFPAVESVRAAKQNQFEVYGRYYLHPFPVPGKFSRPVS